MSTITFTKLFTLIMSSDWLQPRLRHFSPLDVINGRCESFRQTHRIRCTGRHLTDEGHRVLLRLIEQIIAQEGIVLAPEQARCLADKKAALQMETDMIQLSLSASHITLELQETAFIMPGIMEHVIKPLLAAGAVLK